MRRIVLNSILGFLCLVYFLSAVSKAYDVGAFALLISDFAKILGIKSVVGNMYYGEICSFTAILICAVEFIIALLLFSSKFIPLVQLLSLLILVLFTYITAYNYYNIYEQITNCGCFGDLFYFSPKHAFFKSITLLFMNTTAIFLNHKFSFNEVIKLAYRDRFIIVFLCVIAFILPVYSFIFYKLLPIIVYSIIFFFMLLGIIVVSLSMQACNNKTIIANSAK